MPLSLQRPTTKKKKKKKKSKLKDKRKRKCGETLSSHLAVAKQQSYETRHLQKFIPKLDQNTI